MASKKIVYCYDLVQKRQKPWVVEFDAKIRSEYFPGLDPAMLLDTLQREFGHLGWLHNCYAERMVINRLAKLGLRRKRGVA
jgi:hypothetical protein